MHRIFTIPELVSAILTEFVSHGTRGSLVRGPLTVCKLWADVTMDLIWRQIYDPIVIFRLLAPVEDQPRDEDDPYRQGCVSSKKRNTFPHGDNYALFIFDSHSKLSLYRVDGPALTHTGAEYVTLII